MRTPADPPPAPVLPDAEPPANPSSGALGLEPRRAALSLIKAGLERRGGLDEAMSRSPFTALDARGRAYARGLAATTLRRLGSIDRRLDAKLAKPPPEPVRALLRLGVAQLLYRDTPDFAAVDSTVELASAPDTRPFKGLINAVLRGLAREPAPVFAPDVDLPDWLWARWRANWGDEAARAIAVQVAREAATDLTPRHTAAATAVAAALEGELLPGGSVRTARRGELSAWPGFAEGRWWVQDTAAAVPARLLDVQPGESVLDLCAAPGGKTLQLAAAGARVTAVDRSPGRLARVAENLARVGLTAELVAAEAMGWSDPRTFDAVLLDAPCTATGTFRRHPDVLWAARPGEIAKLAVLQSRLLDAAAERVRAGGRMVYCVCSLEPEEGEAQVDDFLGRRADFRLDPPRPGEGGAPEAALRDGRALRILPSMWEEMGGIDGFYIARLAREA